MNDHKPHAPLIDRMSAFVVDNFVLGAVTLLLAKLIPMTSFVHIYLLVSINYFMYCHQKWGQTLGKMVMGLQVVTELDQEPLSPARTLLRELSRLLIPLTLFVGYLTPIFHVRKLALHDILSRTCVISLRSSENSPLKILWVSLASILLSGCAGAYLLLFTGLPLNRIIERLQRSGLHVEGIEGSLYNGFTIGSFQLSSSMGSVSLKQLKFTYQLSELLWSEHPVIEQISVGSGSIQIAGKSAMDSLIKKLSTTDQRMAGPNPAASSDDQRSSLSETEPLSFQVKTVNIHQLQILAAKTTLDIHRVFLSQLSSDVHKNSLTFERLYLDSNGLKIDVGATEISNASVQLQRPTHFTIKKGLSKNVRNDIHGTLKVSFSGNQFQSLSFSMFDNRIRGQVKPATAMFSIQQFLPNQYFNNYQSVTEVNLNSVGTPSRYLTEGSWVGTLNFGSQKVPVVKNRLRTTLRDGRTIEGQISVFQLLNSLTGGTQPSVTWVEKPDTASMAIWYYDKEYAQLTPQQQKAVDGIRNDFGLAPPPPTEEIEARTPSSNENANGQ